MHIPSPNLKMHLPMGQKAQQTHAQFGRVELEGDGRIDESFKQLPGHQDAGQWRDLGDAGLVSFLESAGPTLTDTLKKAREQFEQGKVADWKIKAQVGDESTARLKVALERNQIPASAYVFVDDRGVAQRASIHIHPEGSLIDLLQSLTITQDAQGARAELESRRADGTHKLTVPFRADGSPDLAAASESLSLNTPWLSSSSLSDIPSQGIHSLDDPRLERLAEAASRGLVLPAGEMGPGWKCENEQNRQVWSISGQQVVIDPKNSSFSVSASSWHTGHAGSSDYSVDYEVADGVQWREGKLQRLALQTK